MTSMRQRLGRRGEDIARRRLEADGYSIIRINYRARRLEIDLIAEKDGVLVFVEVRTRSAGGFGSPEESITAAKRSHLVKAAQAYLQEHEIEGREWRIDVVALEIDARGRVSRLDVVENAVEV